MTRRKATLIMVILAFMFMFTTGTQIALAVMPDTNAEYNPGAVTDSDDPATYNIPVANPSNGGAVIGVGGGLALPDSSRQGLGFIADNIADFCISLINSIFNLFGLHSIDQLAENTTGNFWGALSLTDMSIVSPFVIAFTVIAWMIAGVSMQMFSLKLAVSTTNARRRANVIDYFQNWFVGAVFLAVGPRTINLIFQASSAMIRTLYVAIDKRPFDPVTGIFNMLLHDPSAGVGSALAIVVYLLVVTGVTLMLNFIYLQRYVTLFIYCILSPLFMAFYFYDKTRTIFWNWIKEIIGLAFMPAVHMLLITVYMAIADSTNSSNILLRLVFLIMFIPLSEMVRKLTSTAGGTSGLADNILSGMGMGLAMQGVRTLSGGAGALMMGGGMAEAALFGSGNGRASANVKSGSASSSNSGGIGGGPVGFTGGSGGAMERVMGAVNTAKGFGEKYGGVAGAIAGGLMGAGTGNMGGVMVGGVIGQKAGGKAGNAFMGRVAGNRAIFQETHPELAPNAGQGGNYEDFTNLAEQERLEKVFGPGENAPSEMSSEMRTDITNRNLAVMRGDMSNAAKLNADINASFSKQQDIVHGMNFSESDKLVSMGYGDHTDYYKLTADGQQEWLYSSQQGDKRSGEGRVIRSEFSIDPNRNIKETSRSLVKPRDVEGKSGLPQGWNI